MRPPLPLLVAVLLAGPARAGTALAPPGAVPVLDPERLGAVLAVGFLALVLVGTPVAYVLRRKGWLPR